MINKEVLTELVGEWLREGDYFLVDIVFGQDDRIVIEIDHADGVWIDDCAALSRFLQERLGDELGDYELEVGSAGIGQPFKVKQQYVSHVGDTVEVIDADGRKVQGVLKSVDGSDFVVTVQEKQHLEGKKRPVMVNVDYQYNMDSVQSTKYLLAFK
jgi:ribosome maturation factor RimP